MALATALLAGGCAPDRPADPPGLAVRIEGIQAITYDGLDLVVEKARDGAGGSWSLIGPQGQSDMAVLRLGKEFALTDGRTFFTTYRVMSLSEELIAFRKTTRLRRAGEGAADREIADVVQVRPYEP